MPTLPVPRRLRRFSLRTTLIISFVVMAVFVSVATDRLANDAAAAAMRDHQRRAFGSMVQSLRSHVMKQKWSAADYISEGKMRAGSPGLADSTLQVLSPDGTTTVLPITGLSPQLDPADWRLVAEEKAGETRTKEAVVLGQTHRVATISLGRHQGALRVIQQSSESERMLNDLQRRSMISAAAVAVLAAAIGILLARWATRQLILLTRTVETVPSEEALAARIPADGPDEVFRLGRAFDGLLGRLALSLEEQRRLVQDAGHDLRTPITSLRVSVFLARRISELSPEKRAILLRNLEAETTELGNLVDELVDLAAGQPTGYFRTDIRLGKLVESAARTVERRSGHPVRVTSDQAMVSANPAALQRAVQNILENAVKYDDGGQPIEVTVADGRVAIRDHGPGVQDDDLPHIFERSYRADATAHVPGSGLGLAIVGQIVRDHGGSVFASRHPGGGLIVGFVLSPLPETG
ncbi:ATP-binding protein [Streptomyces sp. NPDC086787]|uniref:HAMP domain-containing sensor histidine kinase n=1 Tax=Streptomyces sp. NPDC086787 TaxID=3365759 RepID=UPI00382BC9F4